MELVVIIVLEIKYTLNYQHKTPVFRCLLEFRDEVIVTEIRFSVIRLSGNMR